MKDGENADGTEPTEQQNAARRLAVEACATWIDSFEGYEGAFVTGYVLIVETQVVGAAPIVSWMSGNGVQPSADSDVTEGLATHRVAGMLDTAKRHLDARTIADQLQRLQGDD